MQSDISKPTEVGQQAVRAYSFANTSCTDREMGCAVLQERQGSGVGGSTQILGKRSVLWLECSCQAAREDSGWRCCATARSRGSSSSTALIGGCQTCNCHKIPPAV